MKLLVEVLDTAPADLGAVERLLLVVLAESANDATREGWPGMDVIVRRVGRSESRVRSAFATLAAWQLEVRVPLGTDKHGKPFYAARGKRTTYRIPDLKAAIRPDAIKDGKAAERLAPLIEERRQDAEHLSGEKGNRRPNRKATGVQTERRQDVWRPSLNEPSKNPHNTKAAAPPEGEEKPKAPRFTFPKTEILPPATQIVLDALHADDHPNATADDARAVHRAVCQRYGARVNLNWLRTMAANHSYGPFFADIRSERAEQVEERIRELQRTEPTCEHDTPAGRTPHPTTGQLLCPMCRANRPPMQRQGESTHPDVLAALDAYRANTPGRISAITLMRITQEATALHRRNVPAEHLAALAQKAAQAQIGLLEAAK